MATQQITSANTSQRQVAAGFKLVDWTSGTINLDFGGGKYDDATLYLQTNSVLNAVYDPYNRKKEHNDAALALVSQISSVTCFNVLNVLTDDVLDYVVHQLSRLSAGVGLRAGVPVYLTVYEGDKSGNGRLTKKGTCYQRNQRTVDYVKILERYFGTVTRKGQLITCIP